MKDDMPKKNRRLFLRDALRYPMLGLLIALGLSVRKGAKERVLVCETRDACQECSLSKRCSLKSVSHPKPTPQP